MGLDMYLYRFEKSNCSGEDLDRLHIDEIFNRGYYVFLDDETKPDNYESIAHFAVRAFVGVTRTDEDGIKRDFHIPTDAYCGHGIYSEEKVELDYAFYRDGEKRYKTIIMPRELYDTKYQPVKLVGADCIKIEGIGYWRKDYELQEAFYDACDVPIENLGYYPLNDEMWEVLAEHDPRTYAEVEQYRYDPSGVVCYHEWY